METAEHRTQKSQTQPKVAFIEGRTGVISDTERV